MKSASSSPSQLKHVTHPTPNHAWFIVSASSCVFYLAITLTTPMLIYASVRNMSNYAALFSHPKESLTAVTLSFNQTEEQKMIEHNCAVISRTAHRYVIYTDDTLRPHCDICTCVTFKPVGCRCPEPEKRNCGLCEKLRFLQHAVYEFGEFVFIDSDLIILKEQVLDLLLARSRDVDFLASRGFGDPCKKDYRTPFNSGFMFIRRIAGLSYSDLENIMWQTKANNDQNVISRFVLKYYSNWDTLSLKWHCRYLYRPSNNIPPEECYTFHGRGRSLDKLLASTNKSLLRVIR